MFDFFRNHPILRAIRERETFTSVAGWALPVDFDVAASTAEYASVRAWCRANCTGKWRCEPDRLGGRSVFRFEAVADAILFGLTIPNVTSCP